MIIPDNKLLSETVRTRLSLCVIFRERSSATQAWATVVVVKLSCGGASNVLTGLNLAPISALMALGSL